MNYTIFARSETEDIFMRSIFDTRERLNEVELPATLNKFRQDFLNIKEFLVSYSKNATTYNVYRREVERLLQWSWIVKDRMILSLGRVDIDEYLQFCHEPPEEFIANKNERRFKFNKITNEHEFNPCWRPFVNTNPEQQYILSNSAIREIISVLSTFYTYMQDEGLIYKNPIKMLRQKSSYVQKEQSTKTVRRITQLQWSYLYEETKKQADNELIHERTLFILTCLYSMYLRISELCASDRHTPRMNDFYRDKDKNWWFRTIGKGNKLREVSVSDDMLIALQRYRLSLNLTPLPNQKDTRVLLAKHKGSGAITSTRQIRKIMEGCFAKTYAKMCRDGLVDEAHELEVATVHWLRHTGISEDIKHRPKEHVRDDAGHSSSVTTDRYIDIEQRERHASKRKQIIDPLSS